MFYTKEKKKKNLKNSGRLVCNFNAEMRSINMKTLEWEYITKSNHDYVVRHRKTNALRKCIIEWIFLTIIFFNVINTKLWQTLFVVGFSLLTIIVTFYLLHICICTKYELQFESKFSSKWKFLNLLIITRVRREGSEVFKLYQKLKLVSKKYCI